MLRALVGWVALPILVGGILGLAVPQPVPQGGERFTAVLLADGQAYFGHLGEVPWSDSVELRDVYYFQDAHASSTGLPLGLVKRGSEVHAPVSPMEIRRERILALETVGPSSPVMTAIEVERSLSTGSR